MIESRPARHHHSPISAPAGSSALAERLVRMGLGHLVRSTAEPGLAVLDLFPWWAIQVTNPGRSCRHFDDLAKLLAAEVFNLPREDRRHDQGRALLESALPLGSLAEVAHTLGRVALQQGTAMPETEEAGRAALWALSFLAERPDGGEPRSVLAATVRKILLGLGEDAASADTLRVIGLLACRRALPESADLLLAAANSSDPALILELPGFLAGLGTEGEAALARLTAAKCSRPKELKAALSAVLEGDFDGLAPFLDEDSNWEVRLAAARTVGQLARLGKTPAAALEILLARARQEEDCDTRAVLSEGIGYAVAHVGQEGRAAVLETIRETFDAGGGAFLFDALLLAGGAGAEPVELERCRLVGRDRRNQAEDQNRAINRLLAWVPGYPVSVCDWARPSVYRLLQWSGLELPPAIRGWFTADPTVEFHQVAALLVRDDDAEAVAYCAAQGLRREPESRLPALETLCVHSQNLGASRRWGALCGILAGCPVPVQPHPAELRAGVGARAGTPLTPEWSAAGRLLAGAGGPMRQAGSALQLLAAMGPEFRELARHALATEAEPGCPANVSQAVPRRRLPEAGLLGGSPFRLTPPAELPDELQPIFDLAVPLAWRTDPGRVRGLLVTALHNVDWSGRLAKWKDAATLERIVTAVANSEEPELLLHAVLAAGGTQDTDLHKLAIKIARAIPESLLAAGELGALARPWSARATGEEATAGNSNASKTGSANDLADLDDDELDFADLEELLAD
jgi:hypothetical protein